MSLGTPPLSYCTNVHAGLTLAEVEANLERYTVEARKRFGRSLAAGLWLPKPVIDELLATPGRLEAFAAWMRDRDLPCYTLNAFPYGNFHAARVKENVYLPDWTDAARLDYTVQCATALAALIDGPWEGS